MSSNKSPKVMNSEERLQFVQDRMKDLYSFSAYNSKEGKTEEYKWVPDKDKFSVAGTDKLVGLGYVLNELIADFRIIPKVYKFTSDEKVILRNLNSEYNYLVRDETRCRLVAYKRKPFKDTHSKRWSGYREMNEEYPLDMEMLFGHLFKDVDINDALPCEFRKHL